MEILKKNLLFSVKNIFENINKNILYFMGISVILFFIFIIINSPNYLIYDEGHYYSNTELLKNSSNVFQFIREMKGPVGPLPNFIQFVFGSSFSFDIRFLRLVNLFLIILTSIIPNVYFIIISKKKNKKNDINFFLPIVVCFSIAFTWPIAGMALTEAGSIFFTMLSLVSLSIYINNKYTNNFYLSFSAFSIAMASIGRQTLIVLSPILFLYSILNRNLIKIKQSIIFLLVSLSLPIILFFLWGGIVPQDVFGLEHTKGIESGIISIKSFLLSISYFGFSLCFICPSLIVKTIFNLKGILIFLISILTNILLKIEYSPIKTIINNLINDENIIHFIEILFPIISLYFGLILLFIIYDRIKKEDVDVIEKISFFMIILICISNASITFQFSSRYVAVALAPLIILGSSLTKNNSMFDRSGNILGIFIGAISLLSYYKVS